MPGPVSDKAPVLDLLATMTADSIDASTLDGKTIALTRIAALVSVGAPPASYLLNLGAADEIGVSPDEIRGVLASVAPIVGTARVVAAVDAMVRALGLAADLIAGDELPEGDN